MHWTPSSESLIIDLAQEEIENAKEPGERFAAPSGRGQAKSIVDLRLPGRRAIAHA